MKNIFLTWIGDKDMENAIQDNNSAISNSISKFPQDLVILLCAFPSDNFQVYINYLQNERKNKQDSVQKLIKNFKTEHKSYEEWIKIRFPDTKFEVKNHNLTSPTNHSEIYAACIKEIEEIKNKYPDCALSFQISSGTPSMHAIWILIAKSIYFAELIESSAEGGEKKVEIPFDITAKYLELNKNLEISNKLTLEDIEKDPSFKDIVLKSPNMIDIYNIALKAAKTSVPIYIEGETGTGKEILAEYIHKNSDRKEKEFIIINCGAIPENLIESELFGYEKGAFTGANRKKEGLLALANEGTVFLDEIGDLPLSAQVKLLRVLQKGTFYPVGSNEEKKIDVRIISATNKNLLELVEKGAFREDLYYRLCKIIIHIPPLRERPEDLESFIDKFISKYNEEIAIKIFGKSKKFFTDALRCLKQYEWFGNIRELDNIITRIFFEENLEITEKEVRKVLQKTNQNHNNILFNSIPEDFSFDKIFSKVFFHYYKLAETKYPNNKTKIAKLLGFDNYQSLDNQLKKYSKFVS